MPEQGTTNDELVRMVKDGSDKEFEKLANRLARLEDQVKELMTAR